MVVLSEALCRDRIPCPFLALSPFLPFPLARLSLDILLSHPMSFPTPPSCLFLLLSPLPCAVFFTVGSSGLWTKWLICGKSDNDHSQTSLAPPPVLHAAASFGWHRKLLDCHSHAVPGTLMRTHRGTMDNRTLATTAAGVRLMKRGTLTLPSVHVS